MGKRREREIYKLSQHVGEHKVTQNRWEGGTNTTESTTLGRKSAKTIGKVEKKQDSKNNTDWSKQQLCMPYSVKKLQPLPLPFVVVVLFLPLLPPPPHHYHYRHSPLYFLSARIPHIAVEGHSNTTANNHPPYNLRHVLYPLVLLKWSTFQVSKWPLPSRHLPFLPFLCHRW